AGLRPAQLTVAALTVIHQGVLGTFLQHGKTRSVLKGPRAIPLDEGVLLLKYAGLDWYSHQKAADAFCDDEGGWADSVQLAGWLTPGGVVRHVAYASDTALEERPQRVLLLLFAPVGCFYFNLRSTIRSQKARFALVIPEINDLEAYAERRREVYKRDLLEFTASGTGDAALRLALLLQSRRYAREVSCKRCQVITLGTVPWASQQKTRTAAMSVDLREQKKLVTYQKLKEPLQPHVVPGKAADGEGSFIKTSVALELFGENLAAGRIWYEGFAGLMSKAELYKVLKYEKEGLNKVVREVIRTAELERGERVVVEACHQALRRRYGMIKDRAKREGADIEALFNRENERLRVGLARCKNATSLRQELTDFWSRAGQLKALQDDWDAVLPMLDEHWARARDLALLALASYKKPEAGRSSAGEGAAASSQSPIDE
ncbi:MAG: type I-MYXAN CRISPR-associated Cas8a1/Cmx1, partial [Acidobacteriota bacterium]|nr:type I-MYXAN CRISPR-associated Cas8a1/Cmx1 [Acidobacteriota bacterium]